MNIGSCGPSSGGNRGCNASSKNGGSNNSSGPRGTNRGGGDFNYGGRVTSSRNTDVMTVTATRIENHSSRDIHFREHSGGGDTANSSGECSDNTFQLHEARVKDFEILIKYFRDHFNEAQELINVADLECKDDEQAYHSQPKPTSLEEAKARHNFMQDQVLIAQHKKQHAHEFLCNARVHISNLSTEVIALHKDMQSNPDPHLHDNYLRKEYRLNLEKARVDLLDHAARARDGQLSNALIRKNETQRFLDSFRGQVVDQKAIATLCQVRESNKINEVQIAAQKCEDTEANSLAKVFSFLTTAQHTAKANEAAACKTFTCNVSTNVKWASIEASQFIAFAGGMAAGVPAELNDTVNGIIHAGMNGSETYAALVALAQSGNVLGNVSEAMKDKWVSHLDKMVAAQESGGVAGYFEAGVEGGKLVTDVASFGLAGVGAVKAGKVVVKGGMFAAGKVSSKVESLFAPASKYPTVKLADTGMKWGYPISDQGNPFEIFVGKKFFPESTQSPDKFQVYDYFDKTSGHAVSVKTLNTATDPRLAKPNSVHDALKPYVNAVIDFKEDRVGIFALSKEEIVTRELMVGIPSQTNEAQLLQLQRTIQYGNDNGVKVTLVMVE